MNSPLTRLIRHRAAFGFSLVLVSRNNLNPNQSVEKIGENIEFILMI